MNAIFLTLALTLCGCAASPFEERVWDARVVDFFKLSVTEQQRQFGNLSIEIQYEAFLFGNENVHPPAMYLARPFVTLNKDVTSFLLRKLGAAKNELEIRDDVLLFNEISLIDPCAIEEHREVINSLDARVSAMQGSWRSVATDLVSEIRSNIARGQECRARREA